MPIPLPEAEDRSTESASGCGPRRGFFYGWVIVAVTFLAQGVATGTVFYSYGVLLKPIAEDLGVSRFLIGLGPAAFGIPAALMAPFIGREVDRRSVRVLMAAGAVLLGAGFLGASRATSVWQLYLCFAALISVGMSLLGGIANPALITRWFVRRRGIALGVSQIGVSLSGAVMAIVTTALIVAYGWRTTMTIFGVVPVVFVAPLLWLLVVNRPEDRGLSPDGDPQTPAASGPSTALPPAQFGLGAMRQPAFWLIVLSIGFVFAANGGVILVTHSHVTDLGYSPGRAAIVLSLMAALAAVGKPAFGWLTDHTSVRGSLFLCIALQGVGLVLLLGAVNYPALVVAGLVFGLGYGGVLPLRTVLIATAFGPAVFGRVMGLMAPVGLPFQFLGFPLATFVFDRTGSYSTAFTIFLGFYALGAVLVAFLRLPRAAREERR
jgi:MFS family permease